MRDGQQRPSQRDQQKLDARLLGVSNTCREQAVRQHGSLEKAEAALRDVPVKPDHPM